MPRGFVYTSYLLKAYAMHGIGLHFRGTDILEGKDKLFNRQFLFTQIAVVLFLSTYYVMLPVLPLYMQEMGGDNFQIGLIMGIFSVVSLVFRPISGRMGDRYDPVRLLQLSILLFFLTPLCFLAPSMALVGLAQGLYGLTVGMFTTASGLVVTGAVSDKLIGQAIGIHSIAIIIAKGMAPVLGTRLFTAGGVVPAIIGTAVLALLALFCTLRLKPMRRDSGASSRAASISMLKVFAQRNVWVPALILLSVTITFGAIMTMLPLFAQERGIGNYDLFFTVNTVMVVLVRIATGKFQPSRNFCIISSLIALSAAVALIAFCNSLTMLIITAAVYGYGYGLSYPTLTSVVMIKNPPETRGTAFGAFTAFFDAGVALGSSFAGISEYIGFTAVYEGIAIIPLIGIALYALLLMRGEKGAKA